MGGESGREEVRENKVATPRRSSHFVPSCSFFIIEALITKLFFFFLQSSHLLPSSGCPCSFPHFPGVVGTRSSFSAPQLSPPELLAQHGSTEQMHLLFSIPCSGWSLVQRRIWSFGRRLRFWRTPTGKCCWSESWLSCLMGSGKKGAERSRTRAGRKVEKITLKV